MCVKTVRALNYKNNRTLYEINSDLQKKTINSGFTVHILNF